MKQNHQSYAKNWGFISLSTIQSRLSRDWATRMKGKHRLSYRETLVWLRGCYNFQGCFRWHSTTRVVLFTWARTGASLFCRETSVSRLYSTRGKKIPLPLDHRRPLACSRRAETIWVRKKGSAKHTVLSFCFAGTLLTAIANWATLSCSSMQFQVNGGKSLRRWRRFVEEKGI